MGTAVNGVNVEGIERLRTLAGEDPARAQREPTVVAHWRGGSATRVELGELSMRIGGEGHLNAMQTLLASLAACDVDVVAMHAALLGIEVEELSVEATGHFDVRAYLGVDGAEGSGYDRLSYRVRLRAPGATAEQVAYLRERCERSSPVGDSLSRRIPLQVDVEVDAG